MSKNIKEFIHYYIGQQCQTIAPDGIPHSILETINYYWVERSERDGTQLKPILRKLEDMTEEDKKKLFQKVSLISLSDYDFEFGEDDNGWFVNALGGWGVVQDSIWWKDGCVWAQNNDKSFSPINPQADVFHYLLREGFDLFNLIDAGLAIDTKTIKSEGI